MASSTTPAMMSNVEELGKLITGNMAATSAKMENIEASFQELIRRFDVKSTELKDAIQVELANANTKMDIIINDANKQFGNHQAQFEVHRAKIGEHETGWVNLQKEATNKFLDSFLPSLKFPIGYFIDKKG